MKDKLAIAISAISSPFVIIFSFGLWVVAYFATSFSSFLLLGSLVVLFILLLPVSYILINVRRGVISDVHIAVREQRFLPFLLASIGAFLLFLSYVYLHAPLQLVILALTLLISGIVFGVITAFWKISIHAAAFTGSVLIVSQLISARLFWLLLFLPCISWARYSRKRHNIAQSLVAVVVIAVCIQTVFWFALI